MKQMTEKGEPRLQVRTQFDTNRIHIQGVGEPTVNRKYGIALELRAPPALTEWLSEQEPTLASPASGSMLYAPMSVISYIEHEGSVQLLIEGEELNHPKGAMLDVKDDSTAVATLISFVKESKSGLVLESGEVFSTEEE
tara:strand:- start:907 stop:1323 length:417 start_codon:yes stop_codon:yes gene_type:complete